MKIKQVYDSLTTDNKTNDLTSIIVPKRLNAKGVMLASAVLAAPDLVGGAMQGHNSSMLGRVSYSPTMARMTGEFNTGAVRAMKEASGGNYEAFADMAKEVVSGDRLLGSIETYGATPQLISALYNMGG